ncbi:hypothetical protein INP83_03120 [Mucilaginibacter sp. 21P]|uniref:hypothetical protein n=1 Tax=Mucilaginibacter sp. 21P TaxID=2778902 RepID=UPI001C587F49|nr:hypothetical protein [Mucilaginibacter sp. 21P]QXV66101.1 hypothetical protein INP83_03120 [Mucilaginibacter sp. 21P]
MNNNLRIITTARGIEAINEAVQNGYQPLIKPVMPLPEIKAKFAILRDTETGQYEVANDFRALGYSATTKEIVLDFTSYYPYHFENPFAAYLIPNDVQIGERVYLIDLIEDVIGVRWNQGDTYRVQGSEAIWDGKDFVLDHQPSTGSAIVG